MKTVLEVISTELNLFTCYVVIKCLRDANRMQIFNQIRGLEGVVVIEPLTSSMISSHDTEKYQFSLIQLKFIAYGIPKSEIEQIRSRALSGKIKGLRSFIPQMKTLNKV